MTRHLVKVRAKHIKAGEIFSADTCPVALAINDIPTLVAARVYYSTIGFYDVNDVPVRMISVSLPRSVARFISKLDTKGKRHVKPFNFYLRY